MPLKCCAYACSARYAAEDALLRKEGKPIPALFKAPPGMENIWSAKISRQNWKMTASSRLCERHFKAEDIVDSFEVIINGQLIKEPIRKRLRPDAVPQIFSHKQPPKPKRRTLVKKKPISPKKSCVGETHKTNSFGEDIPLPQDETTSQDIVPLPEYGPLTFVDTLHNAPATVRLPGEDWVVRNKQELAFLHITDTYQTDRYIAIEKNTSVAKVFINSKEMPTLKRTLEDYDDVDGLLSEVHCKRVCPGTGSGRALNCAHIIDGFENKPPPRCHNCYLKKKATLKCNLRKHKYSDDNKKTFKAKLVEKRKNQKRILKKKIKSLMSKLEEKMKKIREMEDQKVQDILSILPPKQRVVVEAIISTAKAKSSKGRRYVKQWMYECILMRFRGPALYRKMQQENILPLPSPRTIQRYLRKMRPAYGFQNATFELLAKKAQEMPEAERHGALLLDEMKLEEGLGYEKFSVRVVGVVDMDKHTPKELTDQPGDHSLVFMFQPFKGTWLQSVAAFLTRGAAKGKELAMLVIDAITRLEQCGFHVDIISSDGASWNRTMWSEMGMIRNEKEKELDENEEDIISALEIEEDWETTLNLDFSALQRQEEIQSAEADEIVESTGNCNKRREEVTQKPKATKRKQKKPNQKIPKKLSKKKQAEKHRNTFVSVSHPYDAKRKLWFASDFPHLVKAIKQRVILSETLQTPDGTVKLEHWRILHAVDSKKGIRIAPKLTSDHFIKEGYIAMKVKLAYSFFSEEVAVALEHYCKERVPGLENVKATVAFIRRMNKLIDVMDSNRPSNSLRAKSVNEEAPSDSNEVTAENYGPKSKKEKREFVEEFLQFLHKWETSGVKRVFRLSSQTAFGVRVTLTAALELTDYVVKELGYSYFMTKRMSQDSLEHFFGKVRQSCGAGSHPTPTQFIQIYRLLSVGSLIKPPRGSNITGAEMLDSLLNVHDILDEENRKRRIDFENALDKALDEGEVVDVIERELGDHRYSKDIRIEEKAIRFFTGYVARKARKISTAKSCELCYAAVSAPEDYEVSAIDDIIVARSRGNLIIPSDCLHKLIMVLETAVLETVRVRALTQNIIFSVLEHVKTKTIDKIGCEVHQKELTKDVISFYLNTRMIFACEEFNKVQSDNVARKRKAKTLLKNQRLLT